MTDSKAFPFRNLFIFEMANNHQGDISHGLAIIDEMASISREFNISSAVKLQYRNLDTFIHPDYVDSSGTKSNKHISRFLGTQLDWAAFAELVAAIRDRKMLVAVTPFDEISVNKCLEHEVDIIKIASCSATDWPLLKEVAAAGKPVIASTGGQPLEQIDKLNAFMRHRKVPLALLHCLAVYPAPKDQINLNFLGRLQNRYPEAVIGYSGHEDPEDLATVAISVAKGAQILERHVGLPTASIRLNAYSLAPDQVRNWVRSALNAQEACGSQVHERGGSRRLGDKPVNAKELESLRELSRGIFARRSLEQGQTIGADDVFFAMPCDENQLSCSSFRSGIKASRNYALNEAIVDQPQPDRTRNLRSLLHDILGMFNEAGISLGSDPKVVISHHYGVDSFQKTGALFVEVVNMHYCKKLVAQLPGQEHPNHCHKIKEETFQVLWGDLRVRIDEEEFQLFPGDTINVFRNVWHSFTTDNGVIFEEISTTSIKDDSVYEDPAIIELDPMWRKTIVEKL